MPCDAREALERIAGASVPQIVHQKALLNASAMPRVLAGLVRRWREVLPRWRHRLWTDEMVRQLWAQRRPDLLDVYDGYSHAVERADASKLLYMLAFGGVYADLDVAPCDALAAALPNSSALLVRDPTRGAGSSASLGAFLFVSPRGHPFFAFAIDGLRRAAKKKGGPMETTGPHFINAQYEAWRRLNSGCTSQLLGLRVLSHAEWQQRRIGSHHWVGTWHAGQPGGLPSEDAALPLAEQPVLRNEELLAWLGVDPALSCPESALGAIFRAERGGRLRREVLKATGRGGKMLLKLQVYPEQPRPLPALGPAFAEKGLLLIGVLSLRRSFALERRMELRGLCAGIDPALVALRFAMPEADAFDAARHADVWLFNLSATGVDTRHARGRVLRFLLQAAFFRRALAHAERFRFVARMQDDAVIHPHLIASALASASAAAASDDGGQGDAVLGALRGWSGWDDPGMAATCRNVPPIWWQRLCRGPAESTSRANSCCRARVIGPFPHFEGAFWAVSRGVLEALVSKSLAAAERRVVASGGRFREDIYSSALLFSAASGRRLTVANVSCADVVPSRKVAIAPAFVYRNVRNNRFQFDRLWERWAALGSQPIPRAGSCEAQRVLVGDWRVCSP